MIEYLWRVRGYWLWPAVATFLLLALMIVLSRCSAAVPFVYSVF